MLKIFSEYLGDIQQATRSGLRGLNIMKIFSGYLGAIQIERAESACLKCSKGVSSKREE
jgi:hypothetical protein